MLSTRVTEMNVTDTVHGLKKYKTPMRKQEKILRDLEFGKDFLNKTQKEQKCMSYTILKINILNLIKIK